MKVYLVNLDKDTEKLAVADRQLKSLNIAYERVSAVYGKSMSAAEKRKAVNYFRWWCAQGRPVADGEIGCALSHYGIYKKMQAKPAEPVCILEDDVVLNPRFPEILDFVERNIDVARPQVIILSDHTNQYAEAQPSEPKLVSSAGGMCTEAYVVTPAAAAALLHQNLPMMVPCDAWGRWVRNGSIELYHALPTTAGQDQITFLSSTSKGRRAVSEYSLPEKLVHYSKRFVGRSIDAILRKVTGK